jgi:two-component system NarL family response regulator
VRVPRTLSAFTDHEDLESLGLRVLLVDDHPLFLTGLHQMLSARGIQVVGMAYDGRQALTMARQLHPNVILMDVNMPHCDGVKATRHILAELPAIKIVMLTVAADDDTLFAALKNGASGYLLKSLDSDTLFRLLSDLMRGEVVIAPGLASRVLAEFARGEPQQAPSPKSPSEDAKMDAAQEETDAILTPRQIEVLRLVSQGLTYKQVAAELYISETTVKYHMGQIVARLHVKNRAEAIAYAVQELDVNRDA